MHIKFYFAIDYNDEKQKWLKCLRVEHSLNELLFLLKEKTMQLSSIVIVKSRKP